MPYSIAIQNINSSPSMVLVGPLPENSPLFHLQILTPKNSSDFCLEIFYNCKAPSLSFSLGTSFKGQDDSCFYFYLYSIRTPSPYYLNTNSPSQCYKCMSKLSTPITYPVAIFWKETEELLFTRPSFSTLAPIDSEDKWQTRYESFS